MKAADGWSLYQDQTGWVQDADEVYLCIGEDDVEFLCAVDVTGAWTPLSPTVYAEDLPKVVRAFLIEKIKLTEVEVD